MKNYQIIFCLILFLFMHLAINAQILNGSFENWDTLYTPPYEQELINSYNVPDPVGGVPQKWYPDYYYGICRTTDSYDGNYAVIIHNWYSYAKTMIGYGDTISSRPFSVTGNFKYIGEPSSIFDPNGYGSVLLKKNNGDTVGYGNFIFDTTSVYTPFEIEINYTNNDVPDSILIWFKNGMQSCSSLFVNVCNLLYLDNINLSFITGEDLMEGDFNFKIFPNPVDDILFIKTSERNYEIFIYNVQGQLIRSLKNEKEINLKEINTGIYYLQVKDVNKQTLKTARFFKISR